MSSWNESYRGHSRFGFTIIELIVAIGVTVILVLGIGRIFTTTTTVISTGQSIAELNQYGRALERLMRHDFANMTRDGFLVIRNERIGLPKQDGGVNPDKRMRSKENLRSVYFNEEDWKADNLGGNNIKQHDMGVRRLDQIVFFAIGDYGSYQYQGAYDTGQSGSTISRNDVANSARIWYGHGLRAIDIYDSSILTSQQDPAQTRKGEIKDPRVGGGLNGYLSKFSDDQFDPADPLKNDGNFDGDGANYYAEDWILAREAAPLLRRESTSFDDPTSGFYNTLSFAPSFIEYFNEFPSSQYFDRFSAAPPTLSLTSWQDYATMRRRLSPGFVDIIDMDLSEVEKTVTDYGWVMLEKGKSFGGKNAGEVANVIDPIGRNNSSVSDWSINAQKNSDSSVYSYVNNPRDRDQIGRDIAENWIRGQVMRMALSTGRIRTETTPPSLSRYDQMLTHATLTPGCSNFEVAWSTGQVDYPSGELVWYDIDQPANPYVEGFLPGTDGRETEGVNTSERRERAPDDPKVWYLSEIPAQALANVGAFSGLNVWAGQNELKEVAAEDLYYANFGYFVPKIREGGNKVSTPPVPPTVREDRSEEWPWPTMIRVRVTLHDQRGLIPGGRTFEFIFKLPRRAQG